MAQWFGPKEPGFETGIRSWQGLVFLVLFLAAQIGVHFLPFQAWGLPHWAKSISGLVVLLIFAPVFYFHYQRD
jgi:hypothetical protein